MADRDHSATMSCVEAVFFALAMSLDGMFGGLGAGFTGKNIYFTVMGSFVVSFCAVLCGCRIGMQASKRWKTDVSWLGGVLFVILGVSEDYLKSQFHAAHCCRENQKSLLLFMALPGVWVIKIFCVWAAHTAAFYGFGNNV